MLICNPFRSFFCYKLEEEMYSLQELTLLSSFPPGSWKESCSPYRSSRARPRGRPGPGRWGQQSLRCSHVKCEAATSLCSLQQGCIFMEGPELFLTLIKRSEPKQFVEISSKRGSCWKPFNTAVLRFKVSRSKTIRGIRARSS